MRRYRVLLTWDEPTTEGFEVDAESQDEAIDRILAENEHIAEDYEVDRVTDLGEVAPVPEPEDPNQLKFGEVLA